MVSFVILQLTLFLQGFFFFCSNEPIFFNLVPSSLLAQCGREIVLLVLVILMDLPGTKPIFLFAFEMPLDTID